MDQFTQDAIDAGDGDEVAKAGAALFYIRSREEVLAKRRAEQDGFAFELFRTGGYARVRLVTLADRASLGALPKIAQNRLLESIRTIDQRRAARNEGYDAYMRYVDDQLELADLMCVAGFMEPRLVFAEEELDGDPRTWLVTDLHPDERIAFMNLCDNPREASRLAPFPRRADDAVLDQRAEQAAPAAQRPAGSGGGRV